MSDNETVEEIGKALLESARQRAAEKAKEDDLSPRFGLIPDPNLTDEQMKKNVAAMEAQIQRSKAKQAEDFMEYILAPGVLIAGVALAYVVHAWAERKGWRHPVAAALFLFLVSVLIAQALTWGVDAIAPDVWLLLTIGLMFAVGKWMDNKFGFKPSVAAVLVIFIASAIGGGMAGIDHSSRCYTDWDGRSNPTICD